MCGIGGILKLDRSSVQLELLQKMGGAMSHRGPDAEGIFCEGPIGFVHRRLSIIDLSDSANQPFVDHSGNFVLIFNGELYNYQEVKTKLADYPFRTSSDTEVLLAAFQKWGMSCLNLFAGMFAFAIWDKKNERLTVARDRMGVKPMYFYRDFDVFAFASEQRALLASGFVKKEINLDAVRDLLMYQSVSHPHSMIKNVEQLEAGYYMTIENGNISKFKYWDITDKSNANGVSAEEIYKDTRSLLRTSVSRRMVSDVPVGFFLSGGIDSSVIVGLAAEVSASAPNTFTIGFDEQEFDETKYAELVAKKFRTNHTNIRLRSSIFLDELQTALDSMDSPSGDGINTYVVSKEIAKQGIKVALSGVGGDELFSGYPFFKQYLKYKSFDKVWNATGILRKAAAGIISGTPKRNKVKQLLLGPDCDISSFYPVIRQVVNPVDVKDILKSTNGHSNTPIIELQLDEMKVKINEFPLLSQVSISEFMGYTQNTLLKDMDQMSMAVSLELREPFFDHELVSYVLNVPDSVKFPEYPKKLLIESVGDLIPDEVIHRKKQGFLFPWSIWMKNELSDFCYQNIKNLGQRPFINQKILFDKWNEFKKGNPAVNWMELWLLVVLEYWLNKNL
ncbi:MAG: asparagine synthase (glutamine-hydrolyzing) [Bacteroidetes bacterium]|nr:MAG: asparagine synthase (glutamine-hydrolyzing) [Bacteroidota bacterium]